MQQGSSAPLNATDAHGAVTNASGTTGNGVPSSAHGAPDTSALIAATKHLTDEQILEMEPFGNESGNGVVAQGAPAPFAGGPEDLSNANEANSSGSPAEPAGAPRATANGNPPEPAWLKTLDAQPEAAAEARRWREAALNSAALDRDYFSASPQDRTGLAARLHETDPAAFRSMLADAARVLAERDPQSLAEIAQQLSSAPASPNAAAKSLAQAARNPLGSPRQNAVGADPSYTTHSNGSEFVAQVAPTPSVGRPEAFSSVSATNIGNGHAFPADAYRQFSAATNGEIERQVRDSIDRTLSSTLPDGVADGARRRIGDDIFRDLNSALSSDRGLSAQITNALTSRRFDASTSQQIASLLANRARFALPEVARRVISEWTSSVLASDRAKNARIESAVSRRDITGGRLPEPIASSALLPRRFDYARTSDEQILEM